MKKPVKSLITMLLVLSLLMSNIAMIATYAALDPYPVELAFNNVFVFEKWANNTISTTVISPGDGTLTTNVENGSFTLTKTNMAAAEIYTAFSMDTANAAGNSSYYMMTVEPNTSYTFSYNVEGSIWEFTPFVFFYTAEGLFKGLDGGMVSYATPAYGNNSFEFTTPADVTGIQIRFTIGDDSTSRPDMTSVYATVKDIAIYKTELLTSNNLFDFDEWATNELTLSPWAGAGTITPDISSDSVTITTDAIANNTLFTGLGLDANSSNLAYYTVDVNPNTNYYLSYNLDSGTLPGPIHMQPWIVELDAEGKCLNYFNYETPNNGFNKKDFTTQAATEYVQVVFTVINNAEAISRSCTISDIVLDTTDNYNKSFEELTGYPYRLSYTYGNGDTYGTLPTPTYAPEGYVFAGWYTGENGEGTRIGADTPVHYSSLIVYPKYEPKVDALTVSTMPAKTTYTVGERFNPTGLVLTATQGENTFNILSGYYCTPEYLTTTGEQTITAYYGGKTATFTVTVSNHNEYNLPVNGTAIPVTIANNEYTLNYNASAFNRYEMTYFSDSYVKGTITFSDGYSEDFFLEPSDNGSFASYIDGYLNKDLNGKITTTNRNGIKSIKFTCLNNKYGNFELLSVNTVNSSVDINDSMRYYQNNEYKVGIDLAFGGVVSYIEALNSNVVAVNDTDENGKTFTKVDYESKLSGKTVINRNVNLINHYDKGRYLQQSYYGTNQPPFEMGDYNGVPWNYNPVQGGNLANEASKIIDFEITDTQIYIKTRPLDWGKNSTEYKDSYNTPSYMEAWYVFEDGMIKSYCRFVDYSGYPSNTTTQEFPALYTIEPLNNFVYAEGDNLVDITEPDFWGVLPSYNAKNPNGPVDVDRECTENWAAFTASADDNSFGIGVYSASITDFHFGVAPAIYDEEQYKTEKDSYAHTMNFRHATSANPAAESPTSYISPVGVMTFESYKPIEYSFYITTGTAEEIRSDFLDISNKDAEAEKAKTRIAVPETVYLNPSDNTTGQHYVNNVLNENNYWSVSTVAQSADDMYFGVHYDSDNADSFSIKVSNVTDASNTITLGNYDGSRIELDHSGTKIADNTYSLSLKNALNPGEQNVAKWQITFYKNGSKVGTHTAYTVLYAPELTVGAVAESRRYGDVNNEVSSWITGINGVDHSQRAPLGSFKGDKSAAGYFKNDPLYNAPQSTGGSSQTATDYINVVKEYPENGTFYENAYVMQTATDGEDDSRSQSYLGMLTVDSSRYTNTNQIPNFKIGFDALRVGSTRKDSLKEYKTYYTLGTVESYSTSDLAAAPSGWTTHSSHSELAGSKTIPYREELAPSFSVSSIDGKYIHALTQGRCYSNLFSKRATAGTSVLCSVTDKGELRDAVLNGQSITKGNYTLESYNNFIFALENASTVLGIPSATQDVIDSAKRDLNNAIDALEAIVALKYDNLFSAHEFAQQPASMGMNTGNASIENEGASIIVSSNATASADVYNGWFNHTKEMDEYYTVSLSGNTEYVFEYDIKSDYGSQLHLFFFDAQGNSVNVTNGTIQDGSGAPKTAETNGYFVSYSNGTDIDSHIVMRFTTPADVSFVSFRLGNTTSTTNKSTFSNIRLIEADKYYEDVDYPVTEDIFEENAEYGELISLSRPGCTFNGWAYADGTTVASTDTATGHKTIYSQWTEYKYTIVYNANGGSGSVANQTQKYTADVTLASSGFTKDGYVLAGWSTDANATTAQYQPGQTVNRLTTENNGTVTLYAVWMNVKVNVTFDNLIDFKAWNKTAGNGIVSDVTDTGMTITCTAEAGKGEATSVSPIFPVEAGKSYKVDVDVIGSDWDIYIFFYGQGVTSGTGLEFSDSHNRYSSNGGGNSSRVFTAPEGAVQAAIRLDSNKGGNVVTFNNIRVYENTGITVSPVNKVVTLNEPVGVLPTPEKNGYDFVGWYSGDTQYTSSTVVDTTSTIYLESKWTLNDMALTPDVYVLDSGLKAVFNPIENDTILLADGASYKISGVSTDATNSSTSVKGSYGTFTLVNDNTVEYVPTSIMKGNDTAYYHVTVGDKVLVGKMIVFPANVVYFEDDVENAVTYTDGVATSGNTGKWDESGSSNLENAVQDLSDKVYGYDKVYNNTDNFSMNSAHVVSVSKYNNPQGRYNGVADNAASWPVAEFTFAGTGFDIVSLISNNTGAIEVQVFDEDGDKLYDWIVDTYYGYKFENNKWVVDSDADNSIYQIPVISNNELAYGTYTVKIIPTYSSRLDHQKDGSYDFYLDAIRVYNPMGDDIDAATVYLNNGEYVVAHQNIRDILVNAGSFGTSNENQVIYINPGMTEGSFKDYSLSGPKNEVYLAKGQSVAFNMTVTGFKPTSVQISAHSLDGTAEMRIASGSSYSDTISISHKTTLYYSAPFTASDYWNDNGDGTYTLNAPIVITNNGDGILSLCNIKVTSDASAAYEPMMFMMSDEDFDTAVYSVSRVADLTSDDGALFVPDDMTSGTNADVVETGEEVLVTINTSSEVYALTVNGENATLVSVNDDGSKTWNYTFVTETRGEMTFTLVAYDAYGFASEETTVTVDVQSKIEIFFNKLSRFFKMIVEFIDKLF